MEDAQIFKEATFRWQWDGPALAQNQGFEVRIWREGELTHYGAAPPVRSTVVTLNVEGAYSVAQGGNGDYLWTVAVVQIKPYLRIGPEAPPRHIVIGENPTTGQGTLKNPRTADLMQLIMIIGAGFLLARHLLQRPFNA